MRPGLERAALEAAMADGSIGEVVGEGPGAP